MRPPVVKAIVLDTGPLLKLESEQQRIRELIKRSRSTSEDTVVVIPVNALAQAWRGGGSRQALLHRMLNNDSTTVLPFEESAAKIVGKACADTGLSDVVDASVAAAAAHYARRGAVALLTSDLVDIPQLLAALNASSVELVTA